MNQEESEQNEVDGMKKGADSAGKPYGDAYPKERLVICDYVRKIQMVEQCFALLNFVIRLIEHGLTSPPTQYRLYGRRFYRSKDPTNSTKY